MFFELNKIIANPNDYLPAVAAKVQYQVPEEKLNDKQKHHLKKCIF
jgi:hypothetical protein